MRQLFDALMDTADGAVVISEEQRIIFWNKAAEEILGYLGDDITHSFCYQIMHGQNKTAWKICRDNCEIAKAALNSKPVPNFDMHVLSGHAGKQWLNVSTFTYRGGNNRDKKVIVHLFRVLKNQVVEEKVLNQIANLVNRYKNIPNETSNGNKMMTLTALSKREREVLSLMAKSYGTNEIGETLSISNNTVRNHVQRIFQKLQVHSRLEAVIFAIKNDLLEI
jgi:DNA-binding CsgD family transcriptional regulator